MNGFVWLVGAGPGSADLLTLKAARCLAQADVVLYDALVSPEVLALAPGAHRFFVGKRAGRKSMKQRTIERLMVRAARRGKRVVRLKCGDPFVFGRGGEEALALAAAGIPHGVVPGVSTAISAAALSGIPVTHRGVASGFVVVSGHSPEAYEPVLGGLQPNAATVVVMMGIASRGALAAFLMSRGWRPDTPAAILWAAATRRARTWEGALGSVARAPEADEAGTIVIGDVVRVAARSAPWRSVG